MKRSFKVLCLMLVVFMMTGCVKTHINMDIKKDKSMDFGITMAVANSLLEQSDQDTLMTDEQLKEAEDEGFQVKDYSDGTMVGYTFTKKFDNIDEISSEKEINFNFDETLTEQTQMFTVKKGFFKNTYTLKMENDTSDELQSGMESSMTDFDDSSSDVVNDQTTTYDSQNYDTSDMDLSALTSTMDMKFNITLPYKAISSNATSTENDGKKLTWNLLDSNLKNVQVEFELYNMNNIYLTVGIGIAIILIIIIIIIIKKRKPKAPVGTPIPVVDEPINNIVQNPSSAIPVNNITQEPVAQTNNMAANQTAETQVNQTINNSSVETLNIDSSNSALNDKTNIN